MTINSWQNQIISGSLLGNAYISRTTPTYLGMSESHIPNWVLYKGQELKSIEAKTPISKSSNVLKWRSKSDTIWEIYRKKFYKDDLKFVEMDTLNELRDIALAIWFGDKGFWYSNKRIGLRTTAFREYNKTIGKFFNEVGIPCEVRQDSHQAYRIVFTRDGTEKFLKTISHRLPKFMYHLLLPPSERNF